LCCSVAVAVEELEVVLVAKVVPVVVVALAVLCAALEVVEGEAPVVG
jgi:hypothetical protein